MPAKKGARYFLLAVQAAFLCAVILSAWVTCLPWPRQSQTSFEGSLMKPEIRDGKVALPFSREVACADIGEYDDQLEAFLRFEYLRGREPDDAGKLLLIPTGDTQHTSYKIFLLVENDRLSAVARLDQAQAHGLISHFELVAWTQRNLVLAEQQSRMLEEAYEVPTQQKLETLSSFQLVPALADFLVFKSQTDWRVVSQNTSAPEPLSRRQALQLASDILDVAHFYSLPLDYFLGVGAMENNYMNVDGDLRHSVWKHRAERGDIVLKNGRRRVLVSDYSVGRWQISRETLRAAHQLFLKDKRDYRKLPARLRPSRQLDLNSVDNEVLTTYAGLMLRELLDRFSGDVNEAIGAYNGGIRNPNPAYAASVKNVALYARRVLEHAPVRARKSTSDALISDSVL